ncbi:MAG: glycosyl transferase [Rickettsiales bacterium]|nr:glycosyl transferase [Rickettsiales bacterium]
MKTIIQILPSLEHSGGGVERGTLDVARFLKEKGYRSIIFSSGGSMAEKYKHKGVEHFKIPLNKKSIINFFKAKRSFRKLVHQIKPDLVHIRSRWPAFNLNKIIRNLNIPLITTYHGTYNGNNNLLKRKYNSVMTEGDIIIAISDFICSHIKKYFPEKAKKIKIVNRGIDTKYFDLKAITRLRKETFLKEISINEKKHIILLPGRLTEWKGQLVAIKAAKILSLNNPDFEFLLLIVGSEQNRKGYLKKIKKLIKKLDIDSHVLCLGNRTDMPSIYSIADVVISSSIEPEAFGRVSAEACAMEKPIVATDIGASKDIIIDQKTGWLVEENNPEALAMKIMQVVKLPQNQKDKMGILARKRIKEKFEMVDMLEMEVKIYEDLIKSKNLNY